ncbi:hypothetical protein C0Q70_04250 [Pomacea canaliculata]|uniref:Uncharacterized protein n=1 Tax=Pomacea canaliculata TaxID=400727 RepID=A0A2T7PV03_POMCA|nr:hypothetical protein C0Q70_04250 [Pomacea canaliculata]
MRKEHQRLDDILVSESIFASVDDMVAAGFSHCVPTPTGQQCQDSMECRDHCCREVRGFRSRYYVCGTPADDALAYTCIKAARSENDVLDYLV